MIKILGLKLEIAQKMLNKKGYQNIIIRKNNKEELSGETIISNFRIVEKSTIILVVSNFNMAI